MTETAPKTYSKLTVTLHWLGALLIIGLMAVGTIMENMTGPDKLALIDIHRKVGIVTGLIFLLRLVFFFVHARPKSDPRWPTSQALAAKAIHALLYLLPIVMVASGMASMVLFGLGGFVESMDFEGYQAARDVPPLLVYAIAAKMIMASLVLHVLAALYHHFIKHDGIFARISWKR